MIHVTDLTYLRNGTPIFDGASFRLYNGRTYGITGEGSEALLAILAGSLGFSRGKINLNGFDLQTEPKKARRGGGYLPADPRFCEEESAVELLSTVAALRGVSDRQLVREVNAMLETAELEEVGDRAIRWLTPAQKRRLWLAQAAIGGTDRLLLAGSAFASDNADGQELWELLDTLRGERTVLIATENASVLEKCDAILRIENGKVILAENSDERKIVLSLTVRGERTAVLAALSDISAIRSCRPGIPTVDREFSLTLTAEDTDPQTLTEQIRETLESEGISILSVEETGKENAQ